MYDLPEKKAVYELLVEISVKIFPVLFLIILIPGLNVDVRRIAITIVIAFTGTVNYSYAVSRDFTEIKAKDSVNDIVTTIFCLVETAMFMGFYEINEQLKCFIGFMVFILFVYGSYFAPLNWHKNQMKKFTKGMLS